MKKVPNSVLWIMETKDEVGAINILNEAEKTGTLIEVFEKSIVWEELGNKVLGSPINIKFRELFKIEKLTVLGDINENFKAKIQAMNPAIKSYVGGIN